MIKDIKGIGSFKFIDNLVDGEGVRTLRRFLQEITIKEAEYCVKHIKNVGFPPFMYTEKQLHTIITPAISDISDAFLLESSVNRKWTTINNEMDDSHGWVDYWCLYKDYNYYMELKHGFVSYRSAIIRQSVKNEWEIACDQLNVINDEINEQKQYAKGIFKIVYHVLPIYIGAKNKDNLEFDKEKMFNIQKIAIKGISDKVPANWSCIWILDDELTDYYEFKFGCEKYPAVLILSNVSEIQK